MFEITVDDNNDTLKEVQTRLKEAGDRGLVRELNKALKAAATEIKQAEQTAARGLPASGSVVTGLRQQIADATTIRVTSGANPGVRVYVQDSKVRGKLSRDTAKPGGWRHPVFGNTNNWVVQVMAPNWFVNTAAPYKASATAHAQAALQAVADQITVR